MVKNETHVVAQKKRKPWTVNAGNSYEFKENEYEKERQERIKRNMEIMRSLGLQGMADKVLHLQRPESKVHKRNIQQKQKRVRVKEEGAERERVTRRTRSTAPLTETNEGCAPSDKNAVACLEGIFEEEDRLLDLEEYFAIHNIDISGSIRSDGHFHGWVCSKVAEEWGIKAHAAESTESSPHTSKAAALQNCKTACKSSKGWSGAKAFAATQLQQNPNAYFYRHVAPDQEQAQGEWSAEEHELFLKVARQWGCGDKWGLFASHIPKRVGYQCSAYYREVLIPMGYIIDPQFKMQRSGRAVYVGHTGK